jgi:ketosteroid isomerase-like protein
VELLVYLDDRRDVFAEGRAGELTCAASLQLNGAEEIARSLAFNCPRVPPPPPWQALERPPLEPLLHRYFGSLNRGDFAAAAACFSVDCVYVHPPYRPGEPQAEFHGRAELVQLWPLRRGTQRIETQIERCVQRGNHAFAEGTAGGGSFLSSVVLDREGLISRYVAFFSPKLVPRLPAASEPR